MKDMSLGQSDHISHSRTLIIGNESEMTHLPSQLHNFITHDHWTHATDLLHHNPSLTQVFYITPNLHKNPSYALPLHHACSRPTVPLSFLQTYLQLYPNAICQKVSQCGRLPLHLILRAQASEEVILYLLQMFPFAVKCMDDMGRLPLHYACSNLISSNIITHLLDQYPSSCSVQDKGGWTPIHVSASVGVDLRLFHRMLQQSSTTIHQVTHRGSTPLDIAKSSISLRKYKLIRMLREEQKILDLEREGGSSVEDTEDMQVWLRKTEKDTWYLKWRMLQWGCRKQMWGEIKCGDDQSVRALI